MGKESFSFKRFTIYQDRTAMKVGTDGVLLGAWAPIKAGARVLDIGTGTGLIAISIAQRLDSMGDSFMIDAIDIDEDSVSQARDNIRTCPWSGNITAFLRDLREMDSEDKYDVIVSNPPFYSEDTSCPDSRRDKARHSTSLPFDTLLSKASSLLKQDGVFSLIFPTPSLDDILWHGISAGLYPLRQTTVYTKAGAQSKRTMIAFSKDKSVSTVRDSLVLNENGNRTKDYLSLVSDFYLD